MARDDTHGLELVFDPALDGGGWPGPLGDRAACIAKAWLGPMGLLERLETELGLGRIVPRGVERSTRLARDLNGLDGNWRASFEADPLGTARRLLADRDALWLWGWRGQPVSDRLAALARATATALPGVPDRLEAIEEALEARRPDIATITLCSPESLLPTRWRSVLAKLRGLGIRISEETIEAANARGDLARAREPSFTPASDGTLTLLRAHGPLGTAEEVAGCLAAMDSLDGVLLVGADPVLVNALESKGLPRPHAPAHQTASQAALRLAIEAMFHPADPHQLYALLTLDPGPIPRSIASGLIHALRQLPGRGSARWSTALFEGLARIDEGRRQRVRERVRGLLDPAARDGRVTTEQVVARLRLLSSWARGFAGSVPDVIALAIASETFAQMLAGLPVDTYSRVELRRLVDELEPIHPAGPGAQAGLASVLSPGAVLGPARIIVWWGFTRDRARRPPRLRLSERERDALRALGVTPPDPGAIARTQAIGWRRPLEQAREALVLCCPQTTDAGERAHPHPLWDELTAAIGGRRAAAKLAAPRLRLPAEPRRIPVALRALPVARSVWSANRPLALRADGESPSSLETLLGCSFAWALRYHGRIARRFGPPASPGALLYGQIAHHVLAEVFEAGALSPEAAQERARHALDRNLPSLCETLLLPRFQVERAELKRAVITSAAELARLLEETGAAIRGVEVPLEASLPELALSGIADLLTEDPDVVIDLKWGRTINRAKMESGTALQLAAYAELARRGPARPEIAYFILRTQELFAEPGSSLPDADSPGEHLAIDIWRGAMAALARVKEELARGSLSAPGATEEESESVLDDGTLSIAPGCHFCDLGALCGRARST